MCLKTYADYSERLMKRLIKNGKVTFLKVYMYTRDGKLDPIYYGEPFKPKTWIVSDRPRQESKHCGFDRVVENGIHVFLNNKEGRATAKSRFASLIPDGWSENKNQHPIIVKVEGYAKDFLGASCDSAAFYKVKLADKEAFKRSLKRAKAYFAKTAE